MSDYADLEAVEDLEPLLKDCIPIEEGARLDGIDLEEIKKPGMLRALKKDFEKSPIPMTLLNNHLRIIFYNGAFYQDIVKKADVVGLSLCQIVDSFEDAEETANIQKALKAGETGFSWRGRIRFSHKAFLTIETNVLIAPVFPGDDNFSPPKGYLCLFDDVTEENKAILLKTFLSLLEASKLKDNDTGFHIQRVGTYSRLLAKWLFKHHGHREIDAQFIEDITFLSPMHDVGKIGTPDDILHKNGSLEDWEWKIMKEHTINGGFILGSYPISMAKEIALFHHEWWDGTGYPYQLQEETIPLSARIVAIADVYDALRMKRSYKEAFSHEKACDIIKKGGASHFDPALTEVFFLVHREFDETFNALTDKG